MSMYRNVKFLSTGFRLATACVIPRDCYTDDSLHYTHFSRPRHLLSVLAFVQVPQSFHVK